ncbi:MAG: dual specificity protein phosphatase family protein [Nitrososphaerota archaeon]|jgi:protein-tyrosine phosphatase|nr:dual specificity protein phosphatase family protein [Nitrososphaerota archaeon]
MATEILPNLFLGDLADARRWQGFAITVLEYRPPELPTNVVHIPIVDTNSSPGSDDVKVLFVQLEALLTVVDAAMTRGEKVLVSCGQGMERSPLAVVWYLFRRRGMSVEEAYRLVREKRPQVIEHLDWLHGEGFPRWW